MYYEINVSQDGKHVFATAEHSILARARLDEVWPVFKKKFPESEGYKLEVSLVSHTGTIINPDEEPAL